MIVPVLTSGCAVQSDEDVDADLARPVDGSDQIRKLAGHVRLLGQQILSPVTDWDADSIQPGCFDLHKVVPGDERAVQQRKKEYDEGEGESGWVSSVTGRPFVLAVGTSSPPVSRQLLERPILAERGREGPFIRIRGRSVVEDRGRDPDAGQAHRTERTREERMSERKGQPQLCPLVGRGPATPARSRGNRLGGV